MQSETKGGQSNYRHFRTFVATSVQITKDLNSMPLYVEENDKGSQLKDTMGFNVSMLCFTW